MSKKTIEKAENTDNTDVATTFYADAIQDWATSSLDTQAKKRELGIKILSERFNAKFNKEGNLLEVVFPELGHIELEKAALCNVYQTNEAIIAGTKELEVVGEGRSKKTIVTLSTAKRAIRTWFKVWSQDFALSPDANKKHFKLLEGLNDLAPSANQSLGFVIPTTTLSPEHLRSQAKKRATDPVKFDAAVNAAKDKKESKEARAEAMNKILKGEDSIASAIQSIKDIGIAKNGLCHSQALNACRSILAFVDKTKDELATKCASKLVK